MCPLIFVEVAFCRSVLVLQFLPGLRTLKPRPEGSKIAKARKKVDKSKPSFAKKVLQMGGPCAQSELIN